MNKHSSPAIFVIVLLLGLGAALGCSEIAIHIEALRCLFVPAIAIVMVIALWLFLLIPARPSTREQHRMRLIEELQRLQRALDYANQIGDDSEKLIEYRIKEVRAEPDFSFISWD